MISRKQLHLAASPSKLGELTIKEELNAVPIAEQASL